MKKAASSGLFIVIGFSFFGCLKTNSTIPITAFQYALEGKWQSDSTVSIFNDTRYGDTVYINHFVTISNDVPIVTITMPINDAMNYTVTSDSSLTPYVKRSGLLIGCGAPASFTKIRLASNQLQFISYDGIYVTTTYMHKVN
jgi:hypothetical protein